MEPPRRPPHVITRDEVGAWLAGSAVQVITVHRTDPASARAIVEDGVDIDRTDPYAAWGRGFYSSTRPVPQYGEAGVTVAIRLTRPLVLDDPIDGAAVLDHLLQEFHTDDIHKAVSRAGYDGVVVHYGPNEAWVVAYRNDQVKVVVEGARHG